MDDYTWGYDDWYDENTDPPNWKGLWIGSAIIGGFILCFVAVEFLC